MAVEVPVLRYAGPRLEARPDEWMEQALCRGKTDGYFYEGFDSIDRMKQAAKACWSCPVQEKCLDTATADDLEWSLRGGLLPDIALHGKRRGRPKKADPSKKVVISPILRRGINCQRGHDTWRVKGITTRMYYCVECQKMRHRGDHLPDKHPPTHCRNGHDKSVMGVYDNGRCRACAHAINRKRYGKPPATIEGC